MPKMVDENYTLEEIQKIPGSKEVLVKYRLPCLTCPWAAYEVKTLKIGEVAKMYGLDLENLLKELNKLP
jgi:hypothetical protein